MKPSSDGVRRGWVSRWTAIREPVTRPQKLMLGIVPIAVLLGVWFVVTTGEAEQRVISSLILPSPAEVVVSFRAVWFESELSRSVVASAVRVIGGFLVALAIVFPLGVLMGSFSRVKAMFEPLEIFGAYLPIPTLVPLSMSLFGIGEEQKIMFLSVAFMVYLLPMFVRAIDEVDDVFLQTALTLGASKWQIVRHVLFGISFQRIFDAMRLGFGIGWTYIILAEMVAADRGLGQIIIIAQRRGHPDRVYLVILIIVVIAYITDKLWVKLGRILFPYREEA